MSITRRQSVIALCILFAVAFTLVLAEGSGEPGAQSLPPVPVGEDQVARGSTVYRNHCVECHGEAMEGFGPFPALAGRVFREHWAGRPLAELHTLVTELMPLTAPGSLSPQQYADVIAYVFSRNGVLPGEVELDPEAEGVLEMAISFGE